MMTNTADRDSIETKAKQYLQPIVALTGCGCVLPRLGEHFTIEILSAMLKSLEYCNQPARIASKIWDHAKFMNEKGELVALSRTKSICPPLGVTKLICPPTELVITDGIHRCIITSCDFELHFAVKDLRNVLLKTPPSDGTVWFKEALSNDNIVFLNDARNSDVEQAGVELNPNLLLIEVSDSFRIHLSVKSKKPSKLEIWFEKRELAAIKFDSQQKKSETKTSRSANACNDVKDETPTDSEAVETKINKKQHSLEEDEDDGKILETQVHKFLQEVLPKSHEVVQSAFIMGSDNESAEKDILVVDSSIGFKFAGFDLVKRILLPNSIIVHIECKLKLRKALEKGYKQLCCTNNLVYSDQIGRAVNNGMQYGSRTKPLRCLVSIAQGDEQKEDSFMQSIVLLHSTEDYQGVNLILILGYGAFVRTVDSRRFTFIKGVGQSLTLLCHAISHRLRDERVSDLHQFIGVI